MNGLEVTLSDKYPDLPWKSARTMRNIIVHDYGKVDVEQVYSTLRNDMELLKESFMHVKEDLIGNC